MFHAIDLVPEHDCVRQALREWFLERQHDDAHKRLERAFPVDVKQIWVHGQSPGRASIISSDKVFDRLGLERIPLEPGDGRRAA